MTHPKLALLFSLTGLVTACGGGDDNATGGSPLPGPATVKGKFVDSPVSGLTYTCVNGATTVSGGETTIDGEFDYVAGSDCTFKLGVITLGSAAAAAVLTPVALVNGAIDETNPTVNNIVRLLMSLDSDADPANGISIDYGDKAVVAALAKPVDVTAPQASFESQANALLSAAYPTRTLATVGQASGHFSGQLLALLAGDFNCQFTGAVVGHAELTISGGAIVGAGTPTAPAGPSFGLSGNVASNGDASIDGNTSTGAAFAGTFTIDGKGSGVWADGSATGAWTCNRR